jgi:hypothetical protein
MGIFQDSFSRQRKAASERIGLHESVEARPILIVVE